MHPADYVTVQRVSRALDRLRKKYQKQNRLLSQVAISSRTYRPETNTVDYAFEIQPDPRFRSRSRASRSAAPSSRRTSRSMKKMRSTMTC